MEYRSRKAQKAKRRDSKEEKKAPYRVRFPASFSLTENPEGVLASFRKIQGKNIKFTWVGLNLSSVTEVGQGAVAYLLSIVGRLRERLPNIRISITWPREPNAFDELMSIGLGSYVHTKYDGGEFSGDTFRVREGTLGFDDNLKELMDFIEVHLHSGEDNDIDSLLKGLRTSFLECRENAIRHAYQGLPKHSSAGSASAPGGPSVSSRPLRWWLVASIEPSSGDVLVSILDQGHGIPNTVHIKKTENIMNAVPGLRLQDSQLLESALNGEGRSQSRLDHRGSGLPWVREQAETEAQIGDLVVVSGRGYYRVNQGLKEMASVIKGTLFSWRIKQK